MVMNPSWWTEKPEFPLLIPEECGGGFEHINYDDECCYNDNTDGWDARKLKVLCPNCGREFAALCSYLTKETDSGWRWVGCDHREPYATFKTKDPKCGAEFYFTIYTPQ